MKEIDWANLSFGYMKTDYNVRCYYRDGAWGELELCSEETLNIHMAATCLHYGQEAFEGLKAYRGKDGKIRIFRPEANAQRLQSTCNGILMPELPTETFLAAVKKVVKANERFIPPYESGASLYIRPLLIGTGAQVGVHPANEYMFVVFVTPVGPYFKGGFSTNPYVIIREFDRAAPYGTGRYKVVETTPPVCVPIRKHMTWATLASSIWMPKKRNTSMSAVPPTSLVSKTIRISLRNHLPSCLPLLTRA